MRKINKFVSDEIKNLFEFFKSHKIAFTLLSVSLVTIFSFGLPKLKSSFTPPLEKYELVKVKKGDILKTVLTSGKVKAERQTDLKFQTSGKLAWVGVKEGDIVKKWQAIASLDKQEVEKNLKSELLDYMKERLDFEEDRQVTYKDKIVTDTIKRVLEKNQFDLDKAVLDVEIKDLAIKLATIYSPIDGIVTSIDSPLAGVNITPATATFIIADPSEMKFVATVDEADIGQVSLGQKTKITLDAYPDKELEGVVGKIAFSSTTTKGGGTAFGVEISLPENNKEKFKVGMNGDAEIIIAEEKDVLVVPVEAIKTKEGKIFVRTIEGQETKEIEVEKGLESDTKVEIKIGLSEGQLVIKGEKGK